MSGRSVLVALSVVTGGFSLAGCAATSTPPTTTSSTTTTMAKVTPASPITSPSVVINGTSYDVPTEANGSVPSPGTATGTQIVIRPDGVLPQQLIAPEGSTITWTNLTAKPVRITFLGSGKAPSPMIKTGGTFTFTDTGQYSFAYTTSTGYQGQASVGQFP
jgi:hypothetical protein